MVFHGFPHALAILYIVVANICSVLGDFAAKCAGFCPNAPKNALKLYILHNADMSKLCKITVDNPPKFLYTKI